MKSSVFSVRPIAIGFALVPIVFLAQPVLGFSGVEAVASSSEGKLLVTSTDHTLASIDTIEIQVVDRLDQTRGEALLAVGPATIQSDSDRTWIEVFGVTIDIDANTTFPRGIPHTGDYVAVTGSLAADGSAIAGDIVHLGGRYEPGNSVIYLRGRLQSIDDIGTANVSGVRINLAQAFSDPQISSAHVNQIVQVVGFQPANLETSQPIVTATAAAVLPIPDSSGLRGINGSGLRGINGSGLRGINGSGLRGNEDGRGD